MGGFKQQLTGPPATVYATSYPRNVTLVRQQFTPIDRHVGTNRCVLPWAFLYNDTLQPEPLQAALAQTLNRFPTLSARVQPSSAPSRPSCCFFASDADTTAPRHLTRKPDWELLLCNAGIPFSVYNSTCSLQELVKHGYMNSRHGFTFPDNSNKASLPAYMEPLDPVQVLSGDAPVLAVRLTQLAGGGSILAVTAAHVVLDGRSYVTFLQHWASQYNILTAAVPTDTGPITAAAGTSTAAVDGSAAGTGVLCSKQVLNDIAEEVNTPHPKLTAASAPVLNKEPQAHLFKADADTANLHKSRPGSTPATAVHSAPGPATTGVPGLSGLHQPLSPRESVTSSRVTVISNCASHHPSSTTAEAPDESSLQLSISVSSTTSTVLSTWSAAGANHCQQPGNAVASPGGQAVARKQTHQGDLGAHLGTVPAAVTAPAVTAAAECGGAGQEPTEQNAPPPSAAGDGPAAACQADPVKDGVELINTSQASPVVAAAAVPTTAPSAAAAAAIETPAGSAVNQQSNAAATKPDIPQQQPPAEQDTAQQIIHPKPFTYTPDPLHATRVPPPGWLPAFKAVKAAHKQIKAEEGHIMRAFREAVMPVASGSGDSSNSSSREGVTPAAGAAKGKRAEREKSTEDLNILSTELMYIPGATVLKLKAAVSQYLGEGQYISSNDVVSSLVWLLMCYLRKRPLPGQTRPHYMQDTYFGVALDLRTAATAATAPASPPSKPGANDTPATSQAPQQQQVPQQGTVPGDYFGSAAWSISVRSCNQDGHPGDHEGLVLPVGWHPRLNPREWQILCSNEGLLIKSLAAGAVRIRGALQAMRHDERFTTKMLQQIEQGIAAPLSSQLRNGAGFVRKIDGFVTSWQFGLWDVGFGGQHVLGFQGLVHPVPPYHAVIMPAQPAAAAGKTYGKDGGNQLPATDATLLPAETSDESRKVDGGSDGVLMCVTVPICLVQAMMKSPVLELLAPDACWLCTQS